MFGWSFWNSVYSAVKRSVPFFHYKEYKPILLKGFLLDWFFKEKSSNMKTKFVPVGETKYSLKFLLNHAIQGILSFNDKTASYAFQLLVYSVLLIPITFLDIRSILRGAGFTREVDTSPTIFSVPCSLVEFQLISIGVLGEYIR